MKSCAMCELRAALSECLAEVRECATAETCDAAELRAWEVARSNVDVFCSWVRAELADESDVDVQCVILAAIGRLRRETMRCGPLWYDVAVLMNSEDAEVRCSAVKAMTTFFGWRSLLGGHLQFESNSVVRDLILEELRSKE